MIRESAAPPDDLLETFVGKRPGRFGARCREPVPVANASLARRNGTRLRLPSQVLFPAGLIGVGVP